MTIGLSFPEDRNAPDSGNQFPNTNLKDCFEGQLKAMETPLDLLGKVGDGLDQYSTTLEPIGDAPQLFTKEDLINCCAFVSTDFHNTDSIRQSVENFIINKSLPLSEVEKTTNKLYSFSYKVFGVVEAKSPQEAEDKVQKSNLNASRISVSLAEFND